MTASTPVPEELLAHAAFVRKLARSLLRDPHDADDLEQETWRMTVERPPAHRQNLKGWLTRVTQSFARRGRRSALRRKEHESIAARDAGHAPIDVSPELQEILVRVAEAVGDLDKKYRVVILARYYRDLSPRAIAAELGIPLETVRTRLGRALELLRARLQSVENDWCAGLIMLVGSRPEGIHLVAWRQRSTYPRQTIAAVAFLLAGLGAWLALSARERPVRPVDTSTITRVAGDRPLNSTMPPPLQGREPAMPQPSTLAATVLAATLTILPTQPGDGITRLVSVGFDALGNPAVGDGDSRSSCISANGRYVAFSSKASNLLAAGQDTNGMEDIFLRDLWTKQTLLVTAPAGFPNELANGPSTNPSITPDGQYLVFDSLAYNLGPTDTNGVSDIYRVSLSSVPYLPPAELASLTDAEQLSNGGSTFPVISDDGTVVAFQSAADNLTSDAPNRVGSLDIYIRDLVAGTTVMASVNNQGVPADRNLSEDQAISGDGRFLTFWSNATNLDPNDTNNDRDVFVFDRQAATGAKLALVSKTPSGVSGNGASQHPCISQSGRYISFMSLASDLVPTGTDTNNGPDLFVRDTWTGQNVLVNLGPGGVVVQAPGVVDNGTMSEEGRFLTFYSDGTEYGGSDTNEHRDVYLIDRDRDGNGTFDEAGHTQTKRVSVGPHNEQGDEQSICSALMANIERSGNLVVFESRASNFSSPLPDTSGASANYDVFVRDMRNILKR